MVERRFGLIVNPIAGMGGAVGLKGSDGADVLAEARRRGAKPGSADRTAVALQHIEKRDAIILVAGGTMGEDVTRAAGFRTQRVSEAPPRSTAEDTIVAARRMTGEGAEFIVFAGGDGTARDIHSVIGAQLPLLGIPTGVKMQSGVFATSPAAAGRLISLLLSTAPETRLQFEQAEVMDIDEDELRHGRIVPRLYGYAKVPAERLLLQQAKSRAMPDDDAAIAAAAASVAAGLQAGVFYLIGPGHSAKQVLKALGLEGNLLGVDVVKDGKLAGNDLSAAQLRAMTADAPLRIIAGITGGQGFLFGRGNQQIAADIIARAGRDGIIVIAGLRKLAALDPPRLLVDTGDPLLDAGLSGHWRVCCGPSRWSVVRVEAA